MLFFFDGFVFGLKIIEVIKVLMDVYVIFWLLFKVKMDDKNGIVLQLQMLNMLIQNFVIVVEKVVLCDGLVWFMIFLFLFIVMVVMCMGVVFFLVDIVVDCVVKNYIIVLVVFVGWLVDLFVFMLENVKGECVQVMVDFVLMQDVVQVINDFGVGIIVMVVFVGVVVDGKVMYCLQLCVVDFGQEGQFCVYCGDIVVVEVGMVVDIVVELGVVVIVVGIDVQVWLWVGISVEQVIMLLSNMFIDLFDGVDVIVMMVLVDFVMIGVFVDFEVRMKVFGEFIVFIKDILICIDNGLKVIVVVGQGQKMMFGVFIGDSMVCGLWIVFVDVVQYFVDGVFFFFIGILIDMYGVLSFDEEKFVEVLVKDLDVVVGFFLGIVLCVQDIVKVYFDKYDGLLIFCIMGQESEVKSFGEQMECWDVCFVQWKVSFECIYV